MTSTAIRALSSEEAVAAQLARVTARDSEVRAWAHIDRDLALGYARAADRAAPLSAMHGLPVGLKDIIKTADQPTCFGSPAWAGFHAGEDAEAVRRLRAAGAVVLGKTTTTEFATYQPSATRNPHNLAHTPGGSSSGSAAAVADGQVRVALGTQTAGSVLRPGSFCGVFTVKPTYGRWPFAGVAPVALTFDTLGGFARDPRDLALLDEVLANPSPNGEPAASRHLPPVAALRVGVLRGPWFDRAETAAADMLQRSVDFLASRVASVEEVDTPPELEALETAHADIQSLEAGWYLQQMIKRNPALVSDKLKNEIAHAHSLDADEQEYRRNALREAAIFVHLALERYDLLVTLAAPGEAPQSLESTGDPAFNRLASTAGLPAVGLPVGAGPNGLPLGLQLIGPRHSDRDLLGLQASLTFDHELAAVPELPGGTA